MSNLVLVGESEGFSVFRDDGGSKWIRDTDIAERAGLAHPRHIRHKAIATAIDDGAIVEVSSVPSGDATKLPLFRKVTEYVTNGNRGGTQAVDAYYLNHAGALVVVQRMRTPKAVELQQAMAVVFVEVAEGRLATADDSLERSVKAMIASVDRLGEFVANGMTGLTDGVREAKDKAEEAKREAVAAREDIQAVRDEMRDGFDRLIRRRDPLPATVEHHTEVCFHMYNGRCPICRTEVIVDSNGRTPSWTIEHFVRRDKNGPHETMPACRACNIHALEEDKPAHNAAFAEYQRVRSVYLGPLFCKAS